MLKFKQLFLLLCLSCIFHSCRLFEKEFLLPLPKALDATSINAAGFNANWQKVTGATNYEIDVALDENFTEFVANYKDRTVEDGTSIVITSLESSSTYYYRVRAQISNQTSRNSNVIQVTTTALDKPVAYEATDIQPLSFRANWKEMPFAISYTLEVATDNSFTNIVKTMSKLTGVTALVEGLLINQTYFYRIKAEQQQSSSEYSNIQSVVTNALPAPISQAPSNQRAFFFTANWQKNEGPEVNLFLLDVASDPEFKEFLPGYKDKEVPGTSYEVTTLDFRQTYYYRIRAKRLDQVSGYSSTVEVKPCISNSCKLGKIEFVTNNGPKAFDQTFTYDTKNRLETISYHKRANSFYKVNYNGDNTIKEVVYTLDNVIKYRYTYTYSTNLLTTIQITDKDNNFIEFWKFAYNAQGQRTSWALYADAAATTLRIEFFYTYDARGNVTEVKNQSGTVLRKYTYEDKLSPYALFGQEDLCFFIAHFRDQWTQPLPIQDIRMFDYEWRGFLPINSIRNVETVAFSDEGFQYNYNNKDVVIGQRFFFTVTFTFTGCSF
ncbi:fibronectin type III domain-containing protein [Microscilla marina]|uniref:Fibronectin type III domain protein n=1 Tax=Microscilla marina ATCC 23134 TaxID=313606 RepID=A1ZQB6_MICM2|nr:fibronectin type III domain-containing protein [Microscilla marina]EAY27525.1 fibronectin type III domain protein [Microscilla marina ATCC 23134]